MIVALMETNAEGGLQLRDNTFQFCSVKEAMRDMGICQEDVVATVKCLLLLHASAATFSGLNVDALPAASDEPLTELGHVFATALCLPQASARPIAQLRPRARRQLAKTPSRPLESEMAAALESGFWWNLFC